MPQTPLAVQMTMWAFVAVTAMAHPVAAQRIEQVRGEPRLILPTAMADAMTRVVPGFRVARLQDYPSDLWEKTSRSRYAVTSRSAPFAVIGDFNGDRVLDLIVDVTTPTGQAGLVYVLSERKGFVATAPDLFPTEGAPSDEPLARGSWIRLVKKGLIESGYEEKPLRLTTDAYEQIYDEKGAAVYYLQGGEWQVYVTSD